MDLDLLLLQRRTCSMSYEYSYVFANSAVDSRRQLGKQNQKHALPIRKTVERVNKICNETQ